MSVLMGWPFPSRHTSERERLLRNVEGLSPQRVPLTLPHLPESRERIVGPKVIPERGLA